MVPFRTVREYLESHGWKLQRLYRNQAIFWHEKHPTRVDPIMVIVESRMVDSARFDRYRATVDEIEKWLKEHEDPESEGNS